MMLVGGYRKPKDLRKLFACGQTMVTTCRKLIRDNPDRYGYYGTIGTLTSIVAFADAYKFRVKLAAGEYVPPFDPKEAAKVVCVFNMMQFEEDEEAETERRA